MPRKVFLITVESLRYDSVPKWFLDKHNPTAYTDVWTHRDETVPSLLSIFTGYSPAEHGVIGIWDFMKYPLFKPTIFQELEEKGIKSAFTSDQDVLYRIKGLVNVIPFNIKEELLEIWIQKILGFFEQGGVFLAMHKYYPTHVPYKYPKDARCQINVDFPYTIKEIRDLHSEDPESAKKILNAKKAYHKAMEESFRFIDTLISILKDVAFVVTSDHGEALGEGTKMGHGQFASLTCTYHVPLLLLDGEGRQIDEHLPLSHAKKLVVQMMGLR